MAKRTEVGVLVSRLKDAYLTSSDTHGGGNAKGYYATIDAWMDAHPFDTRKLARQAVMKAAQIAWHQKPKMLNGESDDEDENEDESDHGQLTINGFEIPRELVYYAPDGGKTKDEIYCHVYVDNGATVGHYEMDCQIFEANYKKQQEKKKQRDALLKAMLKKAKGDRSVLIRDIADDAEEAA